MLQTSLPDTKQLIRFLQTVALFTVTCTVCKSIILLKMLY